MIAAATVGCAPQARSLSVASSGATGCAPAETQIDEVVETRDAISWTSSCQGRAFRCSSSTGGRLGVSGVACTQVRGAPLAASASPRPRSAPPATGVTREPKDPAPGWILRAELREGPLRMVISVSLNEEPPAINWSIMPSDSGRSDINEGCAVVLLIDGERYRAARSVLAGDPQRVRLTVPLDLVKRMAAAQRVVGRVCDEEWLLSPASRDVLKELLTRLQEENLLSAPDPAPSTKANGAP